MFVKSKALFDKTKALFNKTKPLICLFSTHTSSYINVKAAMASTLLHKITASHARPLLLTRNIIVFWTNMNFSLKSCKGYG